MHHTCVIFVRFNHTCLATAKKKSNSFNSALPFYSPSTGISGKGMTVDNEAGIPQSSQFPHLSHRMILYFKETALTFWSEGNLR